MIPSQIEVRIDLLVHAQNPDGGWGYSPHKASWLEPTAYALMALHSAGLSPDDRFQRGWRLLRSWQLPAGAWRPAANVPEPHWTTALCVTLHCLRGVHDEPFQRGVSWLLSTEGAEHNAVSRIASYFTSSIVDFDPSLPGWPWLPGTSSWVEPTSHALFALKMGSAKARPEARKELARRVALGERLLFERRCQDNGWNYGNRRVYGVDLVSYPETTALALLGLKGSGSPRLAASLDLAALQCRTTRSRLARVWLAIALQAHGRTPMLEETESAPDTVTAALEIIAANRVFG